MTTFTTSQTVDGIPMTLVELTSDGIKVNFDAIRKMQTQISDLEQENEKLKVMLENCRKNQHIDDITKL